MASGLALSGLQEETLEWEQWCSAFTYDRILTTGPLQQPCKVATRTPVFCPWSTSTSTTELAHPNKIRSRRRRPQRSLHYLGKALSRLLWTAWPLDSATLTSAVMLRALNSLTGVCFPLLALPSRRRYEVQRLTANKAGTAACAVLPPTSMQGVRRKA
jgi:hypothetical protein